MTHDIAARLKSAPAGSRPLSDKHEDRCLPPLRPSPSCCLNRRKTNDLET